MRTAQKECNEQSQQLFKTYSLKKETAKCLLQVLLSSKEIAGSNPQPPPGRVNVIRNVNMIYPRFQFCMDQWTGENCVDPSGFMYIRTKTTTAKQTSNQRSRTLF